MTILITVINVLLICLLAYRVWRKLVTADSVVYWSALSFKLMASIGVGVVYKYYYGNGDTLTLFDDACKLVGLFYSDPASYFNTLIASGSRSEFFVSFVSIINI